MSGAEQKSEATAPSDGAVVIAGHRYFGAPAALHFPSEAEVPESKRHLELRTLLYQFLHFAFSKEASVGCDQFVYWDPTDPRACLAPDAFVRFGQADDLFDSWKVWERGAPQVAVELVSYSDRPRPAWSENLEKYRRLGVSELVRFDPLSGEQPLRIWDLVGSDLLERQLLQARAESRFLRGFWCAVDAAGIGRSLRLSHDEGGEQLFPTPTEHEAQGRIAAEQRVREAEQRVREAEQRVRELEAELRRR